MAGDTVGGRGAELPCICLHLTYLVSLRFEEPSP